VLDGRQPQTADWICFVVAWPRSETFGIDLGLALLQAAASPFYGRSLEPPTDSKVEGLWAAT